MNKMTKAQAGSLGGKATVRKYGQAHMQAIGKLGAQAFWAKYTVQPCGAADWWLIERATNKVVRKINNIPGR